MEEILKQLLEADQKSFESYEGLMLAKHFLDPLSPCLDGKQCTPFLFDLAGKDAWSTAIKRAAETLAWTNSDQVILAATDGEWTKDESDWNFDTEKGVDASKTPVTLPDGAVMVFDAIITTPRRDHGGDILESKGAELDDRMPLLWQHMSAAPIGKMVKKLTQNSKRVTGRFAIADTPLGRDAAMLVKFGALRISHGFKVLEYEPIKDKDGRFIGWHIKSFKVLETSLVSVPANQDAVIMAHTTGKLHSPLVKSWADNLKRELPEKSVSGWKGQDKTTVQPEVTVNLKVETTSGKSCSCGSCQSDATKFIGDKTNLESQTEKKKPLTMDAAALHILVELAKGGKLDRQTCFDLKGSLEEHIALQDHEAFSN